MSSLAEDPGGGTQPPKRLRPSTSLPTSPTSAQSSPKPNECCVCQEEVAGIPSPVPAKFVPAQGSEGFRCECSLACHFACSGANFKVLTKKSSEALTALGPCVSFRCAQCQSVPKSLGASVSASRDASARLVTVEKSLASLQEQVAKTAESTARLSDFLTRPASSPRYAQTGSYAAVAAYGNGRGNRADLPHPLGLQDVIREAAAESAKINQEEQRRLSSVVVAGLATNRQEATGKVNALFNSLNIGFTPSVQSVSMMRQSKAADPGAPPLLVVTLDSPQQAKAVLAAAPSLREGPFADAFLRPLRSAADRRLIAARIQRLRSLKEQDPSLQLRIAYNTNGFPIQRIVEGRVDREWRDRDAQEWYQRQSDLDWASEVERVTKRVSQPSAEAGPTASTSGTN